MSGCQGQVKCSRLAKKKYDNSVRSVYVLCLQGTCLQIRLTQFPDVGICCLAILARQLLDILQMSFGPLGMQTLRLHIPFLLVIFRESNGKCIFNNEQYHQKLKHSYNFDKTKIKKYKFLSIKLYIRLTHVRSHFQSKYSERSC